MNCETLITKTLLAIIDHLLRGDQTPRLISARVALMDAMEDRRWLTTDGRP